MNEANINLNLTVDETNATLAGISKLPYEVAAGLIEKIRGQAIPQVQAEQGAVQEGVATEPQLLTEQK